MNPTELIVGNLCSVIAMVTDSLSAAQPTAKKILAVQTLSQLSYFTGAVILGGYSAAVQNAVSILRNLAAVFDIRNAWIEWFLVGLGVALGIVFNNLGLMGWLPIIASAQYSIAIFRFRNNERALKLSLLISSAMFAVFSVAILNFVGVVTNTVVAVTAGFSLGRRKNG